MLSIHYLQPAGQATKTSSTSPSHEQFYEGAKKPAGAEGAPGAAEQPPQR